MADRRSSGEGASSSGRGTAPDERSDDQGVLGPEVEVEVEVEVEGEVEAPKP